jgi:hypothetical protein
MTMRMNWCREYAECAQCRYEHKNRERKPEASTHHRNSTEKKAKAMHQRNAEPYPNKKISRVYCDDGALSTVNTFCEILRS